MHVYVGMYFSVKKYMIQPILRASKAREVPIIMHRSVVEHQAINPNIWKNTEKYRFFS